MEVLMKCIMINWVYFDVHYLFLLIKLIIDRSIKNQIQTEFSDNLISILFISSKVFIWTSDASLHTTNKIISIFLLFKRFHSMQSLFIYSDNKVLLCLYI